MSKYIYIYKTLYRAIEYGQVCRSDDSSMTRQKTKLCHRERAKFSVDSAISIFCSTRKKKKKKTQRDVTDAPVHSYQVVMHVRDDLSRCFVSTCDRRFVERVPSVVRRVSSYIRPFLLSNGRATCHKLHEWTSPTRRLYALRGTYLRKICERMNNIDNDNFTIGHFMLVPPYERLLLFFLCRSC